MENEEAVRDSLEQPANKSSVLGLRWGRRERAASRAQPRVGLVQQTLSSSEGERENPPFFRSSKYRRGGRVHLIRNNRAKLLTITSNGLPVFQQWAQQLVCRFLTECKNNNHPLSDPWIDPKLFMLSCFSSLLSPLPIPFSISQWLYSQQYHV